MRGVLKCFPMRSRSHNFPFSESFLSTIGNSQRPLVSKVGGAIRGLLALAVGSRIAGNLMMLAAARNGMSASGRRKKVTP